MTKICFDGENFVIVYSARPMTDEEFEETSAERFSFWKCFLGIIWCVIDEVQDNAKKKKEAAEAAAAQANAAAEVQAYVGKCECSYEVKKISIIENF